MSGDATFSPCRCYRYVLRREWARRGGSVLFILLNPSTADGSENDPTVTRCIGFAQKWGYGRLVVANLFARKATKPKDLRGEIDPVGPENDEWLKRLSAKADVIVAGWGNGGLLDGRGSLVADTLPPLHCLGVTKRGMPRHPLRVAGDTRLQPWKRGRQRNG